MMEFLLPLVLILAGFYVGWNIGANDAANCIGTTVGAQIIPYRKAVLIMAFFVILGGVLQGHLVMKTVGKGIVISEAAAFEEHNDEAAGAEFRAFFPDDRYLSGARPDEEEITAVTGEKVEAIARELWPFILAEVSILIVIAFWSDLTLFIPRLLGL